ncbi:MAG: response regulator [Pseudomonadota bacterium]
MSFDPSTSLTDAVSRELPFLRRFSRALTGDQGHGDAYVVATLEAVVAEPSSIDQTLGVRVGLYRLFHRIWSSSGGAMAEEADLEEGASAPQRQLSRLTPLARQALLLQALEGFTTQEIAAAMDLELGDAEALLASARREIEAQTRGRILIIEDEPIIAMDLEGIVGELGHKVVGMATTYDEAVATAEVGKPDLVLADIQLADGSSGIDAAKTIMAQHDVPVIFITAYPERLLTGERPEPTFLIAKPFKDVQVGAAISQAMFLRGAPATEDAE